MRFWLIFALVGFVAVQPAAAQPTPPPLSVQQEPPARVGAVSYVSGNLAFHMAGETRWSAAAVNYPVATDGSFWTDPGARAQIQIGPSTISMDGGTEIDVTKLNEQVAQLDLPQGRIHLRLRQLEAGQSFEIDLPQGAVWLLQPGSYDIDAGNPNQGARIAVFAGSARFVGSGANIGINSGDAAVLSQTNPVAITTEHATRDAFVEWCDARDYHRARLASPYYISAQMTGYADLDRYGAWQTNPQYGQVWYPSAVPADWAPYRDGRWIWIPPWGWTWVDQQPWGFAPCHYGRWAYIDDRWGWVPGSYVGHPVYAPALVAFVGLGAAGIGVSVGAGPAVGWFPLAPGEVYWPSYTQNTAYIRNVNITNVKNINTVIVESHGGAPPPQVVNANFTNRRFATVVPQRVFANADPVAPAVVHVPPAALQKAPVEIHPPRIVPVVAHAPVAGPGRGVPATALGPNRPAPGAPSALSQPLRPGAAPEHPGAPPGAPGAPGARPASTAAVPPHPGAPLSAEGRRPGLSPAPGAAAAAHGGKPGEGHLAPPGAPATAALPPHPGLAQPGHVAPPGTAALGRPPAAATESVRREAPPPIASPERRAPAAAEIRPAPVPRPEAPAVRQVPPPAPQAQVVHPPIVHPGPPPVHPPAPVVARPEPPMARQPAVHPPAPAPVRPVAPAVEHPPRPVSPPPQMHPQPAAQAHPQPPHGGGRPAPKEKAKEGEGPH